MNQKLLPTVGILIFEDVEVLDFSGPFEVFSVARAVGEHSDESKLFTVLTIASEEGKICLQKRFHLLRFIPSLPNVGATSKTSLAKMELMGIAGACGGECPDRNSTSTRARRRGKP